MVNPSTVAIIGLTGLVLILSAVIITTDTSCPVVETPVVIPCNCTETVKTVLVWNESCNNLPHVNSSSLMNENYKPMSGEEIIEHAMKQNTPVPTLIGY